MEVVRLGDVNVDAYTTAMNSIKAVVPRLEKVAVEGDGLGLEQRLGVKKARVDGAAAKGTCREAELGSVDGAALSFDAGILAPSKNRSGGRPTTSATSRPTRLPPKEQDFARFAGCQDTRAPRPPGVLKARKEARCSNCGLTGHRKTSCVKKKSRWRRVFVSRCPEGGLRCQHHLHFL
jgi:hypothetical protein